MRGLAWTVSAMAACAVSANAAVISVNFVGGSTTPPNANRGGEVVNPLAPADRAGVVLVGNWNNAGTANDVAAVNLGGNKSGSVANLADSTGASTGAGLTWFSNNAWSGVVDEGTPNGRLIKGYLDTDDATTTTVEIAGIPYATYDVVVYVEGSNAEGRIGKYEAIAGTGLGGGVLDTVYRRENADYWDGVFDEATGGSAATATYGDYVVFRGLTSSTLTLAATPAGAPAGDVNPRAPLSGFQIVEVPEPTIIVLLAVGSGLLSCMRFRSPPHAPSGQT